LTISFGDHGDRVTPVPISNTEVKPVSADGTWGEIPWESRTSPDFLIKRRWAIARRLLLFSCCFRWCGAVCGLASIKCPHHSLAAIHLAVLARVVLVRGRHARLVVDPVVAALLGVMGETMAAVVEVMVRPAVLGAAHVARAAMLAVEAVRMLVDLVGRMAMVDQTRVVQTVEEQVAAPTAVLLALVGRAGLVFGVMAQRDLVPDAQARRGQGIRVVQLAAMIEVSPEMIEMRAAVGHIVERTRVLRHAVTGVVATIDGEMTDMEVTVATINDVVTIDVATIDVVMIDVVMTVDPVPATSAAMTTVAEEADIEAAAMAAVEGLVARNVLNGRSEPARTIERRVRNARLVNHVMRPSAVRPRCAHVVVDQLASGNSQPSARNISISGLTRVRFEKKSSK
jgi:hypothetical protein